MFNSYEEFLLSSCVFFSHLNSAVRSCTARHLSDTVEHMGLDRILSKIKVVADRLFPAIVRFTQDSSQQTRLVSLIVKISTFQVAES